MKVFRRWFSVFIAVLATLVFFNNRVSAQETQPVKAARTLHDSLVEIPDTIMPELLDALVDSIGRSIKFTPENAYAYIHKWFSNRSIWNSPDDPLRKAMGRFLYEYTNDQFYLSEWYIDSYDWENIKIPASQFFEWDTIHFVIPAIEEADLKERTSEEIAFVESIPGVITDSLHLGGIDTSLIKDIGNIVHDSLDTDRHDTLFLFRADSSVTPAIDSQRGVRRPAEKHDSIMLVISDTLREVFSTNESFPFSYYDYPLTGDSLQVAMQVLKQTVLDKDSTRVVFMGAENDAPVWLSNGPNVMTRLWLKNEWGEELSIWIGSPSRDSISIIVEKGVHFRRPDKETKFADARINLQTIDNSKLADPRMIDFKPRYWKFMYETSFVFNQAVIKNWSKGGESNISTLMDFTATADYTNKAEKIEWKSDARFKYGLQVSGREGLRKNFDQIDISSKFNNKAFGKFDFSATMFFKTQLANGYNYPNDSVVVSKFFNPATLTLGLGLEYKPSKNTSINFAPLSYKATFVPDTAHIDQTKHGLLADQRSKHEPGLSAQINNKTTLFKKVEMVNKVRLFTNYIHNPLNIDIDWEMIATAKLNWFTDVRVNTHLIYDDDTLIPLRDNDGEPILGTDGVQKKGPRIQFKEIIGVSIIFRF